MNASFKRPVLKLLHQVEGEVGSSRVHLKAGLDLWRLNRTWWLLIFSFKRPAAPPCDWHLHKGYRDHIQIRLAFEMDRLDLTSWFYRDILLRLPSVYCGVFGEEQNRGEERTNGCLARG